MKTFNEFTQPEVITENVTSAIKEANKGREGKPVLSLATGKEIKNSVYLGDGYSAKKDGSTIVISPAEESSLMKSQYISTKHFDILKKVF